MSAARTKHLTELSDKAFSRKYPWDQMAQDICENFYPVRADYTSSIDFSDFAGYLSDGTPVHAHETLSSAIDAMLRQGDWYSLSTGEQALDERPANAAALKAITQKLRKAVNDKRAMFKVATDEADKDWTSVGTNIVSVEADPDGGQSILFRAWHPRDCAWITNERNAVEIFFRKCRYTARDISKKVKQGKWAGPLAPEIERAAQYEPGREFRFIHCMTPIDLFYGDDKEARRRLRHPWVSTYIDVEHGRTMSERGSPMNNYSVNRLRRLSNLPWGFSPYTMNGLSDARMLQDMALVILEQGQKAVDPPVVVSGSVFSRDFNAYAGGVTEADLENGQKLGDVMEVLDTGQRINVGLELKQDVRSLIAESMLLNKLMLPSLREMREVEVMVRTEEFRRAALPFFAPIQTSYHEPVLSLGLEMMFNLRMLTVDMLPPELRGAESTFAFVSPLDEAEGRKTIEAFNYQAQIIATGAQVDPGVAQLWDAMKATETALTATGRPEFLIAEDKRKAVKDEAAQVAAATRAGQLAQQGAGVVADVSNASIASQNAGLQPAA